MKVPRDLVGASEWSALERGTVAYVRLADARYRIEGKGALDCLQGLITTDLKAVPDQARAFGALLTNKGMIVAPLWIDRESAERFTLETPQQAAAALEDTLGKSLPPRLARFANVTASTACVGIYGPGATTFPGARPAVVRGLPGFEAIVEDAASVATGRAPASAALMETCRILAGIPALGSEIDDKTLPQEVRFEELGAISYTKGCYLGQETVARVHFRGHPNRRLALALLDAEPAALPLELKNGDKIVGRLGSAAWSGDLDQWVGQAVVRREVEHDAQLAAGDFTATINLERWLREP